MKGSPLVVFTFTFLCGCVFAQDQTLYFLIDTTSGPNYWSSLEINDDPAEFQFAIMTDLTVGHRQGGGGHYKNFISAVRSGNIGDLSCDIYDGYLSSVLLHLTNISYRLGRVGLEFNGAREKFVDSAAADGMLTREYRDPYVVPNQV